MRFAIAAGDPQTARAGLEILEAGGSAVDAVVAAGLASFVAEPLLSSAGGGGLLVCTDETGAGHALDFFPNMPIAEDRPSTFVEVPIDFGETIQSFHVGRGSVAVPTALSGLGEAHRRFGSLPLSELVQPAALLAREGAIVSEASANVFSLLWPINLRDPECAAVYSSDGNPPPERARLRMPKLSETFSAFAEEGDLPSALREQVLREFGRAAGGVLSRDDFDRAKPRWLPARSFSLGDSIVQTSPRIGGELVQTITEALPKSLPKAPQDQLRAIAEACRHGDRRRQDSLLGGTTHISAIDSIGRAASLTLTNGEGAGHVISGTEIQLNNFLGEADLHPAGFFNTPGGTPLPTMMAPTIATSERGTLVLGSGGANRIRSVVSQVLWRAMMLNVPLGEAILEPRVHAEERDGGVSWFEATAAFEALNANIPGFSEVTPFPRRAFFFGGVHAVWRSGETALACADARRGGAGFTDASLLGPTL